MLRKILPHLSIVLGNMYIVLFLIDRYNRAMAFINNDITKWLLLIFVIVSAINSMYLIRQDRQKVANEERRRIARERAVADQRRNTQHRNYR